MPLFCAFDRLLANQGSALQTKKAPSAPERHRGAFMASMDLPALSKSEKKSTTNGPEMSSRNLVLFGFHLFFHVIPSSRFWSRREKLITGLNGHRQYQGGSLVITLYKFD